MKTLKAFRKIKVSKIIIISHFLILYYEEYLHFLNSFLKNDFLHPKYADWKIIYLFIMWIINTHIKTNVFFYDYL